MSEHRHMLITAGPTHERIDDVRYLANRSSGRMGIALSEAACRAGWRVTLLLGPVAADPAPGLCVERFESTADLERLLGLQFSACDVLIMAAAVADFKPKVMAKSKIKKAMLALNLELERTQDIVSEVDGNFIRVGFAAESENLLANARKKMAEKVLDLIVANDVTAPGCGFGSDTNKVTLISRDGEETDLPLMPKREVADKIWDWVIANE